MAGDTAPDEGEFVETVRLDEAELQALDLQGRLPDVKTQIGLRWLQQWRAGLRALHWQLQGTQQDTQQGR